MTGKRATRDAFYLARGPRAKFLLRMAVVLDADAGADTVAFLRDGEFVVHAQCLCADGYQDRRLVATLINLLRTFFLVRPSGANMPDVLSFICRCPLPGIYGVDTYRAAVHALKPRRGAGICDAALLNHDMELARFVYSALGKGRATSDTPITGIVPHTSKSLRVVELPPLDISAAMTAALALTVEAGSARDRTSEHMRCLSHAAFTAHRCTVLYVPPPEYATDTVLRALDAAGVRYSATTPSGIPCSYWVTRAHPGARMEMTPTPICTHGCILAAVRPAGSLAARWEKRPARQRRNTTVLRLFS
jgi:hypothetical protein